MFRVVTNYRKESTVARPKTIEESERVSLVISKKQLEWVQNMARQMSVREERTITTSEAIRMTIEAAYPPPKDMQTDMFS